jgi:hypothetical protein
MHFVNKVIANPFAQVNDQGRIGSQDATAAEPETDGQRFKDKLKETVVKKEVSI